LSVCASRFDRVPLPKDAQPLLSRWKLVLDLGIRLVVLG
jgi:hypothetical protein